MSKRSSFLEGTLLNVFLLFYLQIQGAICVASLFQIVIGFSGIVGFLLRFIGPLTVAPTVALVGLALFGAAGDFSGIKPFLL